MDEILTIGEIEGRFASEWVLIEDPSTDSRAVQIHPKRFAVIYTGAMAAGTEIVL